MLKETAKENLYQLRSLLQVLKQDTYMTKVKILSGSSIGQHMRHILEFYLIFVSEAKSGNICYDKRIRDIRIENDLSFAMSSIDKILNGIKTLNLNNQLDLQSDFSNDSSYENTIKSSVSRELAYCIEHSIHHQAIIKSALIILGLGTLTDKDFGVAYSTIRYRKLECVQ